MAPRPLCRLFVLSFLVMPLAYGRDEPLRTAADRPADIVHIRLDLNVDIPEKSVTARARIDLTALRDISSVPFNAVDFDVTSVTFSRGEGRFLPATFHNDGERVEVVVPDGPLTTGSRATVVIDYRLDDPSSGLHFFGPTQADPDTPYIVWSQGESVDSRYWIPCFDHPNELQTTEMVVTAAAGNEVISNGRLLSKQRSPDGSVRFHWLQDKPHASYLISLIVGEFAVHRETWRGKPVVYYVPKNRVGDVERSFSNTTRMLEYFSKITGVEYPWDKYAQTCAYGFGGGMENTSATTLGTSTLHDERAHLDFSSDGLIAHELAHQWFGDFVTCKDWSHLWLNEGFASFMDPVWTEFDLGRDEYDYDIYRSMRRAVSGGKKRPVVDRRYGRPGEMFDARSYPKGASILHMLRCRVGDDMFWASIKRYLEDNAHQPVETSDLRKAFERVTGRSLERFFYDWTERPGAPSLDVSFQWSEDDELAEVDVKQTQEEEAFHIPFEVEFRFDDHEPVTLIRDMTGKQLNVVLPLPARPVMVLIDPRDAVLKEIKEHKGRDLWRRQLTDAPYVTARIAAAKYFGDSGRDADAKQLDDALRGESFWGVASEIAEALGEAGGDTARDALLAGLKHPHPKVRRACAARLDAFHRDERAISELYALIQAGDPSYRVEATAIRAYGALEPEGALPFLMTLLKRDSHNDQIRAAALSAMGRQKDPQALDVLLDWTEPGRPRRCRMAALQAIGTLAEEADLSDTDLKRIVESILEHLDGEHRWVKGVSIRTLGKLGRAARSARPALRALAAKEASDRLRRSIERAIEKIDAAQPASVQVDDLRQEFKELRAENEELKKRLSKLEARP